MCSMSGRRGAPRVTEREDPLTFVLRNRPAADFLEILLGKPPMVLIDIRREVGGHPESFRRLASNLLEYELVEVRRPSRTPRANRARPMFLPPPVGLVLTERGNKVLTVARGIRDEVRRQANLLPDSSLAHWLGEGVVPARAHGAP